MNEPYFLIEPKGEIVPIVLSVPHSGVEFPDEIKSHYKDEIVRAA